MLVFCDKLDGEAERSSASVLPLFERVRPHEVIANFTMLSYAILGLASGAAGL